MCCAHCFVDGKHAGHQWSMLEAACGEVYKRVEKKANTVSSMMQACERNLRTVGELHDQLNQSSDAIREDLENGTVKLLKHLDEREEAMHAAVQELVRAKTQMLDDMTSEVNATKDQLQAGTDAALKAVDEQEKYDFIMNSPELENWIGTLADMDINIKINDVGVNLNRTVHWDNVHRTLEGLKLGQTVAPEPEVAKSPLSAVQHSSVHLTNNNPVPAISTSVAAAGGSPRSGRMPGTPTSSVPNAVYVNGLDNKTSEGDLREVFEQCGEIKLVNARHIPSGGFAFIFFRDEMGAQRALDNPRTEIKGKVCNVLAKKQVMS
eukprot:TRINITY_DN12199_c0_g1_i7.p1 TRINITY_DN12199_c0_g1~~TRINITY_DN12199_c0_g1_i7.p1  ORF type:complete len:321 (-),score=97.75 TRINITY_DN12199_c0_g1_i7:363-1325(-)